jgi:sugar lactone lactonase YvrE
MAICLLSLSCDMTTDPIDPPKATLPKLSLEQVYSDSTYELTGVAVSGDGRLFTNYPLWSDTYKYAVAEIKNGAPRPYPNAGMNAWHAGDKGMDKWVCVQAVRADDAGNLWVVDPASPKQKGVYENCQKLVRINLNSNAVDKTYALSGITDNQSYINDVRIDTRGQVAYLTNSSEGGLVVVDLAGGKARQVLQGTSFVVANSNYSLTIDGKEILKKGVPFHSNSDGIALSPDGRYLYFKPLTDDKLYRVHTADLRDTSLDPGVLASRVETVGHYAPTDGMEFDKHGNLYLGDLESHEILKIDSAGRLSTLLSDQRLIWPDSYQVTGNGYLYISCSQIDKQPDYNNGHDERTTAYAIYRVKLPQ